MKLLTRFAPSPTGYLHLGHAAAAWTVWEDAGKSPDHFILRIEDIDGTRCRPEFDTAILEDLSWLGLEWKTPLRRQSEHFGDYLKTLKTLEAQNLIYPCFCTRKDIEQEIANSPSAPHGHEGPVYPETCKILTPSQRQDFIETGRPYALRLDLKEALKQIDYRPLYWHDRIKGKQDTTPDLLLKTIGDVVLARKDTPASYHLCVTHDDALQGINLITRGEDLFFATHLHRLLQELFLYPVPEYHHHPLLTDKNGRRLAKRDKSLTLREIRNKGFQPEELSFMIAQNNFDTLLSETTP